MAAYDIISATEFKTYFGVSGTDKDTVIGTFISDHSLWIEGYLKRKVKGSQTVTAELGNGNGTEIFYPKYGPITAVSVLQSRASPTDSFADIVTDSSNILIDPLGEDYVEVYGTYFPAGRSNIKITYTAGYSTMPAEIKQVCYEMVTIRFRESNDPAFGANRLGMESQSSSESGGTSSKTYADMMPKWERILNRYKRKMSPQAALTR